MTIYDMPVNHETPLGTLVRPSGYVIKPARDYWLGRGRASEKSAAKEALDKLNAKRGRITENSAKSCSVVWQDGSVSNCLHYMVITAAPGKEGVK